MAREQLPREQLAMLKRIMALEFTAIEFNLYLNTHPDDRRAFRDHNETVRELMELRMKYQDEYGPIVAMHPTEYPWRYIETAWPWEIDY
ncbi:spore coat protein CotJB [Halanaerocella petrolearia]